MDNKTLGLMGSAPVPKAIIKLAVPTMLGMVAQAIYNLVDVFFIGMTGDPDLVAGVSLAMPLFFLLQGIGSIFAIGSASYISRKLGEKDIPEARRSNAVSFYLTCAVGGAVTVVSLAFKSKLLMVSGASGNTYGPADQYFTIIAAFAIVLIQNVALQGQVRSEGATMRATIGLVIGIAVNIVLAPLFIFTFGWGIAGAAWATVAGAAVGDIYFILYFRSSRSMLTLSPKEMKPNRTMLAEILKIGVPAAISHIVMSASGIINNNYAASYGDHVVAAAGINMRLCGMAFMLVMGLATGFQPFAGYNYGAGNTGRLTQGLKFTLVLATVLACCFTVLFLLFNKEFIQIFINDGPTIEAGRQIMRAFVIGMPVLGIQVTLMITFQALGKSVRAAIVTLGRQCLFFIPLMVCLNAYYGFSGFVLVQPLSDICTTGIAFALAAGMIKGFGKSAEAGGVGR